MKVFKAIAITGLILTSLSSALSSAAVVADGKYGNCTITGKFGEFKIDPITPDVLTIVASPPHAGAFNGDKTGTIIDGNEYCMAAEIAHRTGLSKVKIIVVPFYSIVAGGNKNYDIALAAISVTPARQKLVTFSIPYFHSDFGVMVKAGTKIANTRVLRGLRVGTMKGTTNYIYAHDVLAIKDVKIFANMSEMLTALETSQIDAIMCDIMLLLSNIVQSGGKFDVVGRYDTGETYAAIYPDGSKNIKVLNKVIQQMLSDGTIKRLIKQYLSPIDVDKIPLFGKQGFGMPPAL